MVQIMPDNVVTYKNEDEMRKELPILNGFTGPGIYLFKEHTILITAIPNSPVTGISSIWANRNLWPADTSWRVHSYNVQLYKTIFGVSMPPTKVDERYD